MLMAWRAPISFSEFALVFMGWRIPTREAPTASPKSMPISGAKNEPSGHGKVLLREQQKDQQMWKHSAVHCQILKRANVQLFQHRKQNLYSFLFTLPKVARLHSDFFLSILVAKEEKLTTLLFHQKWFARDLIRHNFSNMAPR